MKLLSRSILIMLIVDFATILGTNLFWYRTFEFKTELAIITIGLSVFCGIATLFLKENYKIREFNNTVKNTYLLFEGIILSQLAPSFFLYTMSENLAPIAKFYILSVLSIFLILKIYRVLFNRYLLYFKKTKNILIIGTNENARIITDLINKKQALKMNIVGYIEHENKTSDLNILSSPANTHKLLETEKIDIIIMTDSEVMAQIPFEIPQKIQMLGFYDIYEKITNKFFLDETNIERFCNNFLNCNNLVYDICKRILDIVSATIIFTVTLPLISLIAFRVFIIDKNSPFYTQTRITLNGKPFKIFKLRTMYANDFIPKKKDVKDTNHNQNEDDRIIPFCKFIRQTRLDEIPQMINIIKGEMSIVGPRAEWKELVKIYSEEIPYYACRELVKSGWTGWAQINQGHCISTNDITTKLQYDLYYIKHRNLLWEIGILIKAIFMALFGRHK